MKKLGEQWVEVIDGQEHMVKAVPIESEKDTDCGGCTFYRDGNMCGHPSMTEEGEILSECPISKNVGMVAKDLGILRDGVLPCPFCGEYPKVGSFGDGFGPVAFYVTHRNDACNIWGGMRTKSFDTPEQAKDAWNRRA